LDGCCIATGTDAEPGADARVRTPFDEVTYGYVPLINVEHRPLSALKQRDFPAASAWLSVSETSCTHGRSRCRVLEQLRQTGFQSIVESCTSLLRAATLSRTTCSSAFGIGQVAHANASPGDLVLVSRPNTARGGANLAFATPRFRQKVEIAVIRKDEMRLVADNQPVVHGRCPAAGGAHRPRRKALEGSTGPRHLPDHARDSLDAGSRKNQPEDKFGAVHVTPCVAWRCDAH